MSRRVHVVIGEIDHVVVVNLPSWLRVTPSYFGRDLELVITPQPALRPSTGPTKSSQSPGVDIDAIHHKHHPRSSP